MAAKVVRIDAGDGPSVTREETQWSDETLPKAESALSREWSTEALPKAEPAPPAAAKSRCCVHEQWVIVPEETPWLGYWDMWVMALLFLTTYYEPYAVAALHTDPLWADVVNHLLDVTFTVDMVLTFFIAYGVPPESAAAVHSLWVKDLRRIALRYCNVPLSDGFLAGWFWIDLATVLPGWLEVVMPHTQSTSGEALVLLRLLRLFRLTKLVRLQHMLAKWQAHYGFPFYILDLGKFFFITTVTVHWMACVWIIIEGQISNGKLSYKTEQATWLTALIAAKGDSCSPSAREDPNCVYAIALYWSTMTLTTVGYGDITAQNPMEYVICTICMFVVAYVWAYVVGKMVTLLESLDPQWQYFKQSMDNLQSLMDSKCLPRDLQVRLRRYMHESRLTGLQVTQHRQLQERISESLQREVAMSSGFVERFQRGIFWAQGLQHDALLDLVRSLTPCSFGPGEIMMLLKTVVFMRRGIAAVKGCILNRGDIWGQIDILLMTESLVSSTFPRSLSHVDILSLSRQSLLNVCSTFPHADKRLRRAQIRTAVYRAFIRAARARSARPRTTFSVPSAATSFVDPGHCKDHLLGHHEREDASMSELKCMLEELTERNDSIAKELNHLLVDSGLEPIRLCGSEFGAH